MTPEERERWERIDRHMEAAARNHEQLSADLVAMKVIVDRNTAQIERASAQIDRTSAQIDRNSAQIAEQAARTDQLWAETRSELRQLGGFMAQLAPHVQETLQRLDAVIVVLDRHLSNGRA